MNEFLSWTGASRLSITFLLGLCVLAQTLTLVFTYYRHRLTLGQLFENLLEISVQGEILVLSLLHGQVVTNYENSLVAPMGYIGLRIAVFVCIAILAIAVCVLVRKSRSLAIIPVATVSLPSIEALMGEAFPWLFIATMLFWLGRSVYICILRYKEIRTNISVLSVKNAVDTLHTGVLFCESDGYVLLCNRQMQSLMIAITSGISRNAKQFYEQLVSGRHEANCQKTELEGQMVYLLPDGTAWMFTKVAITSRMKKYTHISATDVTEIWALTMELAQQDAELRRKGEELKETIAGLHVLSKEWETQRAKARAHDVLGQRLTVLLHTIRSKQNSDYDLLTSLSKGLLDELRIEQREVNPYDDMKSVQQIFATIGVDVDFKGQLPENTPQARLFVDIIRESVTNAVRHGFATHISIESGVAEDGSYHLTITNNGRSGAATITPGGGIMGIKKQADIHGGTLNITPHPLFTLSFILPQD